MKKLILLIAAAATLFVGCDKENKNDAPFEEQIIGTWVVTEYFDEKTNTYKPVAGSKYDDYYAQLNADKTFTTGQSSGTYVIKNKTLECTYGATMTSKFYIDMFEINGNSAIADYYYSDSDKANRFKARRQ